MTIVIIERKGFGHMKDQGRLIVPSVHSPEEVDVPISESVADRSIIYRLGDSEMFQYANKHALVGGQPLVDVIPHMIVPNSGFTQLTYNDLDKPVIYELFEGPRYKLSCRKTMKDMLANGTVVMVYSEKYKLPTCIPYIVQGRGSSAKVFVNVSDFVQLDQYGKYQVVQARNYNGLMAAIFSACVVARLVGNGSSLPADLADGLILVYSAMLERSINSLIHMDPITKEKVRYFAAEFALIQMYGTNQGQRMFFDRYKPKYFPKLSKMITDSMDAQFHTDAFDSLSSFCNELKTIYPSMHGLTEYLVMDKWIRLYGAATAIGIDYIGYHLYTICMVLFESPLISRMALEPVMEKNKGLDMYKRMQQVIGSI